jgi:hypothetical protein
MTIVCFIYCSLLAVTLLLSIEHDFCSPIGIAVVITFVIAYIT